MAASRNIPIYGSSLIGGRIEEEKAWSLSSDPETTSCFYSNYLPPLSLPSWGRGGAERSAAFIISGVPCVLINPRGSVSSGIQMHADMSFIQ